MVFLICRYAIGGFDGERMVSSVEIYDPRRGTWMEGEGMRDLRGYSAVAVVKDTIYVIGGYKGEEEDILDTVRLVLMRLENKVKPLNIIRPKCLIF